MPGEPIPFIEAINGHFARVSVGDRWGAPWSTVWFRLQGNVPEEWFASDGHVPPGIQFEILVDLGFHSMRPGGQSEALVYTSSGDMVKALEPRNNYIPLDDSRSFEFLVEASAIPDILGPVADWQPTSMGDHATAGVEPLYVLKQFDLVVRDTEVWELAQDIRAARGLMHSLPPSSTRRARLLQALDNMLDAVDPAHVGADVARGRQALTAVLAEPAPATSHKIIAVGHAHIDSVWLWPTRETIRKCARTFSNVLRLMDEYPEFIFACSSAQQFCWIRDFYPPLFERIKARVADGRFVPVGGMWVESDTNLPGGESMARQFIEGKKFFLDEFGIEPKEVWLPDSFGYSAALPQIARLAGAKWFLTQKISWNQINPMPHHTFQWEGIDGTRVFTHFPPIDTYIAELTGEELHHAESNFREKRMATLSLAPFGWGDGGGGPTREHLAAARRTRSLEGSPRVEIARPDEFFEAAQLEYPDPPVWSGELYLETHRGTYTSHARIKRGNRQSERLLHEAELWSTAASLYANLAYPYDKLEECWRIVLLQQFHDVLPGSSIAWVNHEAERNYERVAEMLDLIITGALDALVGEGGQQFIANAAPFARDSVAAFSVGIATRQGAPSTIEEVGGRYLLDNGLIAAIVDERGCLASLRDLASGREAIAPGAAGNLLQLHRDTPNKWDAWDLDEFYRRTVQNLDSPARLEIVASNDGSAGLVIYREFGSSSVKQRVALAPGSAAVDIETRVDWRERDRLLKQAFPFDVHADRFASEIQFGYIERPTHVNTSWDAARFETVAQRWIRVGEPGYGVVIANDSTYGHDVRRTVREDGGTTTMVRLSLLRSPRFPDPETDQGEHVFRISVRPAASIVNAVEEGYRRNLEPRQIRGERQVPPLVTSSNPGVVVETIKLAEDRSGDVIVRLYESTGGRIRTSISWGFATDGIAHTDLLERPLESFDDAGEAIELTFRPFEIRTLRARR
ncbi:MAG TPA: glycoside hydrolase family 38 C-terminal domain-containing protein [Galbitalea sp.]|nr:glycoside hydrolase family 38 C-terminal domain-containing protein [Galbitalea sp.]